MIDANIRGVKKSLISKCFQGDSFSQMIFFFQVLIVKLQICEIEYSYRESKNFKI